MTRTLAFAILVLGISCATPAFAQKSDSKVKVKTTAGKPDERGVQKITLELTIEPEWYIYANPVKNEDQVPAQTTLTIRSESKLSSVKIVYPEGTPKTVLGETMQVYEASATIQASVQRPPGDANPLKLTLQVNACRKTTCLQTGKILIDVP